MTADVQHPLAIGADGELEAAIEITTLRLQTARTPIARRKAWATLQTLVGQRSRKQILRMEARRGLIVDTDASAATAPRSDTPVPPIQRTDTG